MRSIAVQPVPAAVGRSLPSPVDIPPAGAFNTRGQKDGPPVSEDVSEEISIEADPAAVFCALVFKVQGTGGRKIVFLRIYAGTVREGDTLLNSSAGKRERVMRSYRLHAARRESRGPASAGAIVTVPGLKEAQTGDTLVDEEPMVFRAPITTRRPVTSLIYTTKNSE